MTEPATLNVMLTSSTGPDGNVVTLDGVALRLAAVWSSCSSVMREEFVSWSPALARNLDELLSLAPAVLKEVPSV